MNIFFQVLKQEFTTRFQNISILDLGKKIQKIINCEIEIKKDVKKSRRNIKKTFG